MQLQPIAPKSIILIAVALIAIVISIISFNQGSKTFGGDDIEYTHYNNYIIFKQSFYHLVNGEDLYQLYPSEHFDYYKYSPTFALFFGSIAWLPDFIGLILWNLLNMLVLYFAFLKLPFRSQKTMWLAAVFILIECITSLQNSQSNALITGLIIGAFLLFENKKTLLATLLIALTVYIKLFGLVAFVMVLFYPDKIKNIAYSFFWILLLAILPLIAISYNELIALYESWIELIKDDQSLSWGLSVMGWLYSWFGLVISKNLLIIIGAVLFCIPLFRIQQYKSYTYRILFLASILIWIVIFNHKAESPTFIIAVSGAAIWFFIQKQNIVNLILILLIVVFSIISPTDLFPRYLKDNWVNPYVLKAVPLIFIWIKLLIDQLSINFKSKETLLSEW
jgi:hypothetical protein